MIVNLRNVLCFAAAVVFAVAPVAMGDYVTNLYASVIWTVEDLDPPDDSGWVNHDNIIGNTPATYTHKVCSDGHFVKVTDFDDFDGTGKTITGVRVGSDLMMENGSQYMRQSIKVDGTVRNYFKYITTDHKVYWATPPTPGGGWTEAIVDGITNGLNRPDNGGTGGWTGETMRQYRSIVEVTWTPEPASGMLLLAGSAGLALCRRKRRA